MRTKQDTSTPTQAECTICLCNDSPDIGVLKCKHGFCFSCIESWSEHENSCPLCKSRFSYIDRVQTNLNEGNGKPVKTRVKTKKRNQADYDITHRSQANTEEEDDEDATALWANFIGGIHVGAMANFVSGLVGQSHRGVQRRLLAHMGPSFEPTRVRRQVGSMRLMTGEPPSRTAARSNSFLPIRTSQLNQSSAANPIELSDDENVMVRTGSSSSSSGPLLRAGTSASSGSTVDLIDLTDDAEPVQVLPRSLTRPALTSTAAAPSSSHLPLHPTTAMSSFGGNYNLMDFLSEDEDDEDYMPPVDLEELEMEDDNSELSDILSISGGGVIELNDSEDEQEDVGEIVGARVNHSSAQAPSMGPRVSGIMVWCAACDSFHDKQRVYDDASYCPTTYASLERSVNGFAGIQNDHPIRSAVGSSSSSSSASSSAAPVSSFAPSRRTPAEEEAFREQTLSRFTNDGPYICSAIAVAPASLEEAEWTSDDSSSSAQWLEARRPITSGYNGLESGSSASEADATISSLARTQSDATTASSRSCTSQVPESLNNNSLHGGVELPISRNPICDTSSSSSAGTSTKRDSRIAYIEEGESLAKRQRTVNDSH